MILAFPRFENSGKAIPLDLRYLFTKGNFCIGKSIDSIKAHWGSASLIRLSNTSLPIPGSAKTTDPPNCIIASMEITASIPGLTKIRALSPFLKPKFDKLIAKLEDLSANCFKVSFFPEVSKIISFSGCCLTLSKNLSNKGFVYNINNQSIGH